MVFGIDMCSVYTGYIIFLIFYIGALYKVRFIQNVMIWFRHVSLYFDSIRVERPIKQLSRPSSPKLRKHIGINVT